MDIKEIRLALGLSQPGFAAAYRLPLRTVQDWEYGKTRPDAAAAALLRAIAAEPETMRRLLA